MSHVNIARLVIDNQEPGLAQLGSVWLPLNHVLPLLFVWNDWAWQTGLAASIFSMASFVIATLAIYEIVYLLSKKKAAGIVGALAFVTNLNMLYLQTTPLTEPLYVGLFSLSALFFTLWLTKKDNTKYLLILGIIGFLQVVARYDGWFVVAVQGLLIGAHELILKRRTVYEASGKIMLFGLPIAFGAGVWFLWNAVIFGDPLYFILGPYSARAQQLVIEEGSGLITKGNILYSVLAYSFTMLYNVGEYALILATVGIGVFLLRRNKRFPSSRKTLFLIFLASPIFFNVLALFLGFSILNVPALGWNPSGDPRGQWFNVRYGILALPFVAILIGLFASWRKLAVVIALELIILQAFLLYNSGIITIIDGTAGSSSFRNYAVAEKLQDSVKPDETVLMSVAFFNPVAFKSGIQMDQVIHEGVSKKWNKALRSPAQYADWIVMGGVINAGDPVGQFLLSQGNISLEQYEKVFENEEAIVYRLKKTGK